MSGDRAGRLAAAGVYAEIGFMLFFCLHGWLVDTCERYFVTAARARRRAVNRRGSSTIRRDFITKTIATDEP